MFRLASIIYALTGPTLAGSLVVAALVTGYDTLHPIAIAAALGFVAALPVAWVIADRIAGQKR